MNEEDLDIFDAITHISNELLAKFNSLKNDPERRKAIDMYLKKHSESKFPPLGDFQKDGDWFNITEPIQMSQLVGKVVVLDFFTYCCINCMHILPDLKSIESAYPIESGLVVIGVHSAKFDNERDSANLLSAIQRYSITHPVINDINSEMWTQLKIKCWPTLLIVSPHGTPLLVLMGEGHKIFLNKFIAAALAFYGDRNELSNASLPLNPATNLMCASNLRFPGKICNQYHDELKGDVFAVSDSGNHRILLINSEGQVLERIGGYESGFVDGDYSTVKFNSPQGVAFLDETTIFVADTENHAIRKIDLTKSYVSTLTGTGVQGSDRVGGLQCSSQVISSPWDVTVYKTRDLDMSFHLDEKTVPEKNVLLIAMAGTHQIWAVFLDGLIWWKFKKYEPMSCVAIIGNGMEENRNNSYPQNAAFAQPSGLDIWNDTLLVADSESSTIRKASLVDGKVAAVVGGDRNPLNLFAFGDVDGKQYSAKLQHPLGICYNRVDGFAYVADTYNHKIKRIDLANNTIGSCLIRDKSNHELFQFSEPSGLCTDHSGKLLYVTDTNNHNIQVVDLETMLTWPLMLKFNLCTKTELDGENVCTLERIVKINSKCKLVLNKKICCDQGMKLTEGVPQKWSLNLNSKNYSAAQMSGQFTNGKSSMVIDVICTDTVEQNMQLNCHVNICAEGLCMTKKFRTNIKLVYSGDAANKVEEDLVFLVNENHVQLN